MKLRLQTKMILLIGSLLTLLLLMLGMFFQYMLADTLKQQIGTRALRLAQTVASIPEIKEAFKTPDPAQIIQPMVESIRQKTDAEFIVVGNTQGIRYSHPVPERIGKKMVGGDNGPVLQGQSIISEAVGTLGPSLRGKTPILDDQDRVIGIVSVGFLLKDIEAATAAYRNKIILIVVITLLVGTAGAILISQHLKKSILGLEPEEIAALYQEKRAILESIREGIIAVDMNGKITMANQTAMRLLGMPEGIDVTGHKVTEMLPHSRLMEVIASGESEFDKEMVVKDNVIVVNRVPIRDHRQRIIGAVSSFRNKSELARLSEELTQVKRYAEALRAQTHEFSNKLYMISGLIQLESYQEAIDMITQESNVHQNLLYFIMKEIPDPMVGGLLIGKFNRAKELKVELEIDQQSSFRDLPASMDRNELVTILGNLIENAMEAVLAPGARARRVSVFLTDLGEDLIVEVDDEGVGISEMDSHRIFEIGYSSKDGQNRGFGLALVKRAVEQLHGTITFSANSSGGTVFTVAIPKGKRGVA